MSSSKPWDRLTAPSSQNDVNMLRVDGDHRWNLYWARSSDGNLLLARLRSQIPYVGKLPSFRGLRLVLDAKPSGTDSTLMLELLDESAEEMFLLLCQDIVEATRESPSEQELVKEIVARTWMWHRFLQKGNTGLLTAEEQRGLVGELTVLERLSIPVLGHSKAVEGWTGPVGTARDFEHGSTCVEVKAKRAPSLPFVKINSEFQLDESGLDSLFLVVVDVTATTDSGGQTLNEITERLHRSFESDGETLELFYERLTASGYLSAHDYSEWKWSAGDIRYFEVTEAFPSVRHSKLPAGISNVEYRVSVQQCRPFEVDRKYVESVLTRCPDGQ